MGSWRVRSRGCLDCFSEPGEAGMSSFHPDYPLNSQNTHLFKYSRMYMSIRNSWVGWLWWLLLCVSLTRDAQAAGKMWFLGVSVEVFQEEISIWIGELSKTDEQMAFLNVGRCSQSFEGLKRTQRQRKVDFLSVGLTQLEQGLVMPGFQALQLSF